MERAELISWIRNTGCAEEHGGFVFLCDPDWTAVQRAEAGRAMALAAQTGSRAEDGWLCIRTGGSSGGVRFARHDELTLSAAVRSFCEHFGFCRVNTVGVLPPWHVSGLMARLRCAATAGEYVSCEWRQLEAGSLPALSNGNTWVLSLVPTQLQRLLGSPRTADWLRRFDAIFVGGGPVWPGLADAAADAELPIALSYGMTETAAMVAAQRPSEFRDGDRSSGTAMPQARISVTEDGRVCIAGQSLFRGYFPDSRAPGPYVTQDIGRLDEHGRLHVLGRADAVIITGGKKVQPAEVEALLRDSGQFEDVAVIGMPDSEWGEAVVACHPAQPRQPDLGKAVEKLAPWERPKRFVALATWPRTPQGKIDRAELRKAVERAMP